MMYKQKLAKYSSEWKQLQSSVIDSTTVWQWHDTEAVEKEGHKQVYRSDRRETQNEMLAIHLNKDMLL